MYTSGTAACGEGCTALVKDALQAGCASQTPMLQIACKDSGTLHTSQAASSGGLTTQQSATILYLRGNDARAGGLAGTGRPLKQHGAWAVGCKLLACALCNRLVHLCRHTRRTVNAAQESPGGPRDEGSKGGTGHFRRPNEQTLLQLISQTWFSSSRYRRCSSSRVFSHPHRCMSSPPPRN